MDFRYHQNLQTLAVMLQHCRAQPITILEAIPQFLDQINSPRIESVRFTIGILNSATIRAFEWNGRVADILGRPHFMGLSSLIFDIFGEEGKEIVQKELLSGYAGILSIRSDSF
jgi:hypothetical protein